MTASHPEAASNPGAGFLIGCLILLIAAAAAQSTGALLAAGTLFIGSVVYRRMTAPERPSGSERRHLALSGWQTTLLLAGAFVIFLSVALLSTR